LFIDYGWYQAVDALMPLLVVVLLEVLFDAFVTFKLIGGWKEIQVCTSSFAIYVL